MRRKKACKGMTLIEVLTVLFIIGLMISIAVPFFGNSSKKKERNSATMTIGNIIREARQLAVSRNAIYNVDFLTADQVSIKDVNGNQEGKTYFLPQKIQITAGPNTIQFAPQGHINSAPGSLADIKVKHDNAPQEDVIDIIESTGQININKN